MAKLGKEHQQRVAGAAMPEGGGGFTVVPDGLYLCTFKRFDVLPAKSSDKFAQWQIGYDVDEDITEDGSGEEHSGERLIEWFSLSPKDYPVQLLKEWFTAFGATPDADTDDLLGSQLVLDVGHEVATFGKRKDQVVNTILRHLPANFGLDETDESVPAAPEEEKGEEPF